MEIVEVRLQMLVIPWDDIVSSKFIFDKVGISKFYFEKPKTCKEKFRYSFRGSIEGVSNSLSKRNFLVISKNPYTEKWNLESTDYKPIASQNNLNINL
jgi:hypothetical protein